MAEEKKEEQAKIDTNKQEKLKDKIESQNKDDQVKQLEPAELRKELSNKNSDYVFRLQKELELQGKLSQAEAASKVDEILPQLVVAQHHGQPASTYYNMAPKLKAADMLKPKVRTPADIPFWQYAVDSALLYIAIFVGLFGVIALFQTNQKASAQSSQMGILTLLVVGAMMGVFMTKYNEWVIPAQTGNKKIPWTKLILGMVAMLAILFVLIWVLSIPALRIINPVLSGFANIIVAAVAYGLRWLFRRHYQIIGSVFTPTAKSK
ncbi:DUF1129 family protein [Lactobacillus sp. ESL0731]|uniref:DUF1129 family protein n=1 Tax=unclassified Lactobacillus TaxID=2620435 RepID=UPI0023F93370|nr:MULTISPECIES: DUF1129 family protein [unclassified Lactobacillus]WEV51336.1 DUF1129 family protein [Lactobacillus sp. ESL0700]WEV62466.1 DUF1129 family protein [Lactobacillus sp. ESL0731]